ncbi:MAG TPA: hypothetical protein ENG48_10005 [Candidatus Atribacteria bacterium]|nr:hypothetical protein [Candidatus Atribacteria bacterium]
MDWKKIIFVIILIAILLFTGYKGYLIYQERRAKENEKVRSNELRLIELLNDNQEAIVKLYTKIAAVEKKVVGGTLKETTTIGEEAKTYNELKKELIELKKDDQASKEEIESLRKEFEERIKEFKESRDKIMLNTGEEKIVIYEDEEGNLVSLDSGIKITRHRKAEEVIKDLKAGDKIEEKEERKDEFSFNIIYDIDKEGFYPGLSYQLWDWKNFSINITGYDIENIKGGVDLSYNIAENIVVGAGLNLLEIKDFKFNLDNYYLKAGIEFSF